ncbi:ABC transporter ATP-binding protein [Chloroflexia bacterium SDU3-3]|nr:ABC transporter ATP-binding protein [Chloroflexia bacterium SDU3-3]
MDTVISIEGLGKQYRVGGAGPRYRTLRDTLADMVRAPLRRGGEEGQFWALRDLSFQIGRGEVVGIIGRNGAGKSTLLKILSRITGPTVGRIRLRGRVGTLLEVGTGFHPELSGRENIFLNGAILGMHRSEIARKFDEIVEFAEVERFIDTPVKHYSSGMYLRLAFAVAAHLEPEILIVDEVLAVGDATFQKKCLGKMGDVARAGRTVLFVSHNMGAIRGLCQRAIWLDRGGVVADGPVFEVVDRYLQTSFDPALVRIDLRETPRTGGMGRRMKLSGITFNDGAVIQHGEPLRATFSYTTSAECDSVALGFGFSTLDGVRILSVDSDVGADRRDLPAGASGSATVELARLDLQPGHYALDVGARSGDNSALDYMPGCAQIEVLPGPSTPSAIIRDTGGVRAPGAWGWADDA